MIRWQKIKTVATFEFLSAVKRPGYLITTFGMPLFMAAYGGDRRRPGLFRGQARSRARGLRRRRSAAGVLG